MQVVHGRNEQTVAEIDDFCFLIGQRRQICRHTFHVPICAHGDIAVLQHLETILLFRIKDVSFINFLHFSIFCDR